MLSYSILTEKLKYTCGEGQKLMKISTEFLEKVPCGKFNLILDVFITFLRYASK